MRAALKLQARLKHFRGYVEDRGGEIGKEAYLERG